MMISKDSHTQHISQQFNAELEEVRSHLLASGRAGGEAGQRRGHRADSG